MAVEPDGALRGGTVSPVGFLTRSAWREPVAAHRLMFVIVALMVVTNMLWGERVHAGSGLGWDGQTYGALVRDFDTIVRDGKMGTYYAQRVLPALSVRALLQLVGAPLDNGAIILAFSLLNGTLVLLMTEIWRRTANELDLGLQGRWLGFTALFLNFELSKQNMFYPVLTDVATLFLAALLVLLYLKRAPIKMVCVTVAGAFCWPTFAITGALLIALLPTRPGAAVFTVGAPAEGVERGNSALRPVAMGLVVLICVIVQLPVAYDVCARTDLANNISSHLHALIRMRADNPPSIPCQVMQRAATAMPSLLAVALAILKMVIPALRKMPRWTLPDITGARLVRIALAAAALTIPWAIVRLFANTDAPNPNGILLMTKLILLPNGGKVFLPAISAVVFWGPMLLLLLLRWDRSAVQARALGSGAVLVVCLAFGLGLAGEPRFLTTAWPLLVVVGVLSLERMKLPASLLAAFVVCSFLLAQFWLPINLVPWSGGDFDEIMDFPKQLYFMHYGLWMGWPAYAGQFVVLLAMGVWLWHGLEGADGAKPAIGINRTTD